MEIREILKVQAALKTDIDGAIKDSVKDVVKRSPSPQEPDFVASLTINFTKDLYHILKKHFSSYTLSVQGIFCHQKPILDISEPKDPELGDLLLIYHYTDMAGKRHLNSILFQAKITRSPTLRIATTDLHQLKLYEQWPDFIYQRAGKLNGTSRKIQPKAVNDGAQYLLIDDHPVTGLACSPGTYPMGTATPNRNLTLNGDLSDELVNFLKFKSGRSFEDEPKKTKDEWTKMIWDLIEITKGVRSRRRNYLSGDFDRQHTYLMTGDTNIKAMIDLDSELSVDDNAITGQDDTGMSIVVIESAAVG